MRLIQLTNTNIGAVAAGNNVPLGRTTRLADQRDGCCNAFSVTTSSADTIEITKPGIYSVNFSGSLTAGAAGVLTLTLVGNGVDLYTVSQTVANTATANIHTEFDVRAIANCAAAGGNIPYALQLRLGGIAITGGIGNTIITEEAAG